MLPRKSWKTGWTVWFPNEKEEEKHAWRVRPGPWLSLRAASLWACPVPVCSISSHSAHLPLCLTAATGIHDEAWGIFLWLSHLRLREGGDALVASTASAAAEEKRASNRACIWRNKSMLVWGVFSLFVKGFRGSLCLMSLSQQPQRGCRIIQRWWITRGQTTGRHVSLYCSGHFLLLKIHLNIVAPLLKRDHKALLNLASDWDFSEFSVQYFSSNNSNRQAVTERKIIWITFKCSFLK